MLYEQRRVGIWPVTGSSRFPIEKRDEYITNDHFINGWGLEVHRVFVHPLQRKETASAASLSGPDLPGIFLRGIAAILLIGVFAKAVAQDAGSLLREQQRQEEPQKLERLPKPEEPRGAQEELISPTPPRTGEHSGETILVRELRFAGRIDLLPPDTRARFAAAIQNSRAGVADLQALAEEVTAVLQKQGSILARATLAPQDITEGIVTIDIIDGRLEQVDIRRGKGVRVRDELLHAFAERRMPSDSVTRQSVEETLLRMNALPGVTARGKLSPGASPNTSRLIVDVKQDPVLSASVWSDNYGSPNTGRGQINTLFTLTDLTGLGDLIRFTGTVSQGQTFGQTQASLPWGASGFTWRAGYSHLTYRDMSGLGRLAGLKGLAHDAVAGLDYDLVHSRGLTLKLSMEFDRKGLVDTTAAGRLQDKRIRSGNLILAGELQDAAGAGALTTGFLAWTWGDLDLSRLPAALAADAAGLMTQGAYRRVSAGLARLQALPAEFSLFTRLYGQWADKNLDSSEEFALGGPYGVRGWPSGEGRGDMGLLGTAELRYDAPVPPSWRRIQLSAFVDGGRVWVNKNPNGVPLPTVCACNTYSLTGAGLGVRWTRENLGLTAFYAHGLGENPGRGIATGANADGRTGQRQFWLQGTARF